MSAHRYRLSFDYARDAAGAVLGSAKLVFSTSGGAVPLSVYTDAGLTAAATTITADSAGLFGDIFLGNGGPYRVELWNNALTTMYWREDPVYRDRVRLYLSALPSVNWPGLECVVANILYERNEADTGWNNRGNVDTLNALSQLVNYQTGATYTILATDNGKIISHGNAGAVAVTLPVADAVSFPNGWSVIYRNTGVGAITIMPTTSTINGVATLILRTSDAYLINSDGTNYIATPQGPTYADLVGLTADATGATGDLIQTGDISVPARRQMTLSTVQTLFAASAAQQETGSSTAVNVTPGVQHRHASAAKCWIYATVPAGVPQNDASYNITSVTDTAVGRMVITIATDFSTALWSYAMAVEEAIAATELIPHVRIGTIAAGSIEVDATAVGGAANDPSSYGFQGFGDHA